MVSLAMRVYSFHECAGCRDLRRRVADLEDRIDAQEHAESPPVWPVLPRTGGQHRAPETEPRRRVPAILPLSIPVYGGRDGDPRWFTAPSTEEQAIPMWGAILDLVA